MSNEERVKKGFWRKVKTTAAKVPFVGDAIAMYYCMLDSKTPVWVKASVALALVYFISPVDAIPDMLVPFGFADDATVIAATLKTIGAHLTSEHHERART